VLSTPHLLLGAVLTAVTAVVALLVLGSASRSGLAALVAVAGAGGVVALVTGVATLADAGDPAALAAGAGATALVTASMLPRASIALARLPLPQIPSSAEELADDPGVAEHAEIEQRTDRAHAAMTGLLTACGLVTAGAVAVVASFAPDGVRGVFAWILAALLTLLLALRSRTYANGAQALSLLVCALVAAATLAAGALAAVGPGVPALGLVAVALVLGTVALLLGVAVPGRRFSPVARRAVDIAEAVGIAAVLPVALAVMDLYTAMRLLSGG
jgi:type VII secretion integral membrane protein EccD